MKFGCRSFLACRLLARHHSHLSLDGRARFLRGHVLGELEAVRQRAARGIECCVGRGDARLDHAHNVLMVVNLLLLDSRVSGESLGEHVDETVRLCLLLFLDFYDFLSGNFLLFLDYFFRLLLDLFDWLIEHFLGSIW